MTNIEEEYINESNEYYAELFENYGRTPQALGWSKGRQEIRFEALTKTLRDLDSQTNFNLLDYGCGFGDLHKFLRKSFPNMKYTGVDIFDKFIDSNKADSKIDHNNAKFELIRTVEDITEVFDFVVVSGTFNLKSSSIDMDYDMYVAHSIRHLFSHCKIALSSDFMSPNVDFKSELTHHQDITKLICNSIEPGTKFIIDSTYLPFEYSLTIFKKMRKEYD